jgi:hypothetical protein
MPFTLADDITIKSAVFWNVAPSRSWVNRRSFETSVDLHGSTSRNTAFFIVSAVKTSDLRYHQRLAHSLVCCWESPMLAAWPIPCHKPWGSSVACPPRVPTLF